MMRCRTIALIATMSLMGAVLLTACDDEFKFGDPCGDGAIGLGETCDIAIAAGQSGACPISCDDSNACTVDALPNAGTCLATCNHTDVTTCMNDDGCCPSGCSVENDNDCDTICGDGVVTGGEKCDTAIAASQPGACPTTCNDGNACTTDAPENFGTCAARCVHTPITACGAVEGCCPAGCTSGNDTDCLNCGNGTKETYETCDTSGTSYPCPTSCTPPITGSCTTVSLQNAGTCAAVCVTEPTTACHNNDDCCPIGCDANNDNDCCVDQTGTWISRVMTTGAIIAPVVGTKSESTIDLVQRMVVSKSGNDLSYKFEMCSLETYESDGSFKVTYTPEVLMTFTGTETLHYQCVKTADTMTLPSFTIKSGWTGTLGPTPNCPDVQTDVFGPYPYHCGFGVCSEEPDCELDVTCRNSVDSDGDCIFGITLNTELFGTEMKTFTGLTINIMLNDMIMVKPTEHSGYTNFTTVGFVYRIENNTSFGKLEVKPNSTAVPVTAIKLPGDVPCSTVLEHCTGTPCIP